MKRPRLLQKTGLRAQHLVDVRHDVLAERGECDGAGGSQKQAFAQLRFQLRDAVGKGRLRDVTQPRGTGEGARAGHRTRELEMTEVHFPLIARLNERDAKTQFPYEFATAYSLVHCAVAAYPVELKRGGTMVYLQISLDIAPQDRPAAAAVYHRYKGPFLAQV